MNQSSSQSKYLRSKREIERRMSAGERQRAERVLEFSRSVDEKIKQFGLPTVAYLR